MWSMLCREVCSDKLKVSSVDKPRYKLLVPLWSLVGNFRREKSPLKKETRMAKKKILTETVADKISPPFEGKAREEDVYVSFLSAKAPNSSPPGGSTDVMRKV